MPERTKRGEEDRKHEDEQLLTGEPTGPASSDDPDQRPVSVTRDRSVEPASDERREGQGAEQE